MTDSLAPSISVDNPIFLCAQVKEEYRDGLLDRLIMDFIYDYEFASFDRHYLGFMGVDTDGEEHLFEIAECPFIIDLSLSVYAEAVPIACLDKMRKYLEQLTDKDRIYKLDITEEEGVFKLAIFYKPEAGKPRVVFSYETDENIDLGRGLTSSVKYIPEMPFSEYILSQYLPWKVWSDWSVEEKEWASALLQQFPTNTRFIAQRTTDGLSIELPKVITWDM